MKKLMLSLLLVMGLLVLPTIASAANVFTMTPYQLGQLYQVWEDPASTGTYLNPVDYAPGIGAKYTGNIRGNPGYGTIDIGANTAGLTYDGISVPTSTSLGLSSLSGYNGYALSITNENENPWDYALFFSSGSYFIESAQLAIPAGVTSPVYLDFANAHVWQGSTDLGWQNLSSWGLVDLSQVSSMGLMIGAQLPLPGTLPDYHFETTVMPIPEPSSMLLLGMGILGVFGLRRKKA